MTRSPFRGLLAQWLEWGENPHLVLPADIIAKTKEALAKESQSRKEYMANYMREYRKRYTPKPAEKPVEQTLILQVESEPEAPIKKVRNLPTSESAKRIAGLFSRRLSTGWSDREHTAHRKLGLILPETMDLIDEYYAFQRSQPRGYHRRDLSTFLNNFQAEVDRALAWKSESTTTQNQQRNDSNIRL
tara:strand:+ start:613 stop:1176 length:564 start_codon:yes stop_codon:yes gene_type:complete